MSSVLLLSYFSTLSYSGQPSWGNIIFIRIQV
uniref:Uncharacterized protein n=1 Tax=Rhizophora mucronata TaxID=61149 RepID=A0A2P2PGY0_RHIMU